MAKTNFAQGQLKSLVERIERLEDEKAAITSDIKGVYDEAKANGFDVKILRKLIALRKKEAAEREEEQALLEVYMGALGMLPLFEAAEVQVVTDKLREPDPGPAEKASGVKATVWCAPELAAAIRGGAEAVGFEVKAAGHDPETGEIIDETSAADLAVPAVGEEGGGSPPVIPPSTPSDPGPMPAFLDRRRQVREGAQC